MIKRIALTSVLIVLVLYSMTWACPMCRDSVANTSGGNSQAPIALFNASVLCILTGFLLVAGFLTIKIVGAIRSMNQAA